MTERPRHHHGNLRAALITAGIEMLEAGEPFSLRALARKVGVSQAAPYRHFAAKHDIEAAMAVYGFGELRTVLDEVLDGVRGDAARVEVRDAAVRDGMRDPENMTQTLPPQTLPPQTPLVELALAYIHFAEAHPALYALMFGADLADEDERREACAEVFALIEEVAAAGFPDRDAHGLATAGWALAHGMATLHLEGTLGAHDDYDFDTRVRSAFAAVLGD